MSPEAGPAAGGRAPGERAAPASGIIGARCDGPGVGPESRSFRQTGTMSHPGGRVLLVEDNEENREIYATILRHHGYGVLEVEDGREALRLAEEERPDLILLDISIPGLDGWRVAERLKEDDATREIPVIALTAHALPEDYARARELGCDAYLSKPVRPQRVVEEVRRFLDPGPEPSIRPEEEPVE